MSNRKVDIYCVPSLGVFELEIDGKIGETSFTIEDISYVCEYPLDYLQQYSMPVEQYYGGTKEGTQIRLLAQTTESDFIEILQNLPDQFPELFI